MQYKHIGRTGLHFIEMTFRNTGIDRIYMIFQDFQDDKRVLNPENPEKSCKSCLFLRRSLLVERSVVMNKREPGVCGERTKSINETR